MSGVNNHDTDLFLLARDARLAAVLELTSDTRELE